MVYAGWPLSNETVTRPVSCIGSICKKLVSAGRGSSKCTALRPRSSRPTRLRIAAWLPSRPAITLKFAGAPPNRAPSGSMSHNSSPIPRIRCGSLKVVLLRTTATIAKSDVLRFFRPRCPPNNFHPAGSIRQHFPRFKLYPSNATSSNLRSSSPHIRHPAG